MPMLIQTRDGKVHPVKKDSLIVFSMLKDEGADTPAKPALEFLAPDGQAFVIFVEHVRAVDDKPWPEGAGR
jgi:hypothetical protein